MADYVSILKRTLDGLGPAATPALRERVYTRAREAVKRQLDSMNPPPADDVVTKQFDTLDRAIAEVEAGYAEPVEAGETDSAAPATGDAPAAAPTPTSPGETAHVEEGPGSSGKSAVASELAPTQETEDDPLVVAEERNEARAEAEAVSADAYEATGGESNRADNQADTEEQDEVPSAASNPIDMDGGQQASQYRTEPQAQEAAVREEIAGRDEAAVRDERVAPYSDDPVPPSVPVPPSGAVGESTALEGEVGPDAAVGTGMAVSPEGDEPTGDGAVATDAATEASAPTNEPIAASAFEPIDFEGDANASGAEPASDPEPSSDFPASNDAGSVQPNATARGLPAEARADEPSLAAGDGVVLDGRPLSEDVPDRPLIGPNGDAVLDPTSALPLGGPFAGAEGIGVEGTDDVQADAAYDTDDSEPSPASVETGTPDPAPDGTGNGFRPGTALSLAAGARGAYPYDDVPSYGLPSSASRLDDIAARGASNTPETESPSLDREPPGGLDPSLFAQPDYAPGDTVPAVPSADVETGTEATDGPPPATLASGARDMPHPTALDPAPLASLPLDPPPVPTELPASELSRAPEPRDLKEAGNRFSMLGTGNAAPASPQTPLPRVEPIGVTNLPRASGLAEPSQSNGAAFGAPAELAPPGDGADGPLPSEGPEGIPSTRDGSVSTPASARAGEATDGDPLVAPAASRTSHGAARQSRSGSGRWLAAAALVLAILFGGWFLRDELADATGVEGFRTAFGLLTDPADDGTDVADLDPSDAEGAPEPVVDPPAPDIGGLDADDAEGPSADGVEEADPPTIITPTPPAEEVAGADDPAVGGETDPLPGTAEPSTGEGTDENTEVAGLPEPEDPVEPPAPTTIVTPQGPEKFQQRLGEDGVEVDVAPGSTDVATVPVPTVPTDGDGNTLTEDSDPPAPASTETPLIPNDARSFLVSQGAGGTPGASSPGGVAWSVVEERPGGDLPPEPAIRGNVAFDDGTVLSVTIKRNADTTLPASHLIELFFDLPGGAGGADTIESLPLVGFKDSLDTAPRALESVSGKITDTYFIVGLEDIEAVVENNLALMREEGFMDVELIYGNGRRATLTMEKGDRGTEVFDQVLTAWRDAPLPG